MNLRIACTSVYIRSLNFPGSTPEALNPTNIEPLMSSTGLRSGPRVAIYGWVSDATGDLTEGVPLP